MTVKLIIFKEALKKADGKKRLLLGNGFSIACKKDIFAYNALLDEADFSLVSPCVREAFDLFETQDFEIIIRKLYDAAKILTLYNGALKKHSKQLTKDADTLKKILVKVISGKHPSLPTDINDSQYNACSAFLSPFETLYTINYDLLLYWTLMHDMEGKRLIKSINDGFVMPEDGQQEYVVWDGSHSNTQSVFYLHGGLHIFDAGTEFQKLTYCNTEIPLMEQIRKALDKGLYPHFVAEGSWQEKLKRVNHSIFLNKGYKSLQSISGNLFIYGNSLAENDEHILHIIENGKLENVFISLYGKPSSRSNQQIINRADLMKENRQLNLAKTASRKKKKTKASREELNIYYFDAESAKVWG